MYLMSLLRKLDSARRDRKERPAMAAFKTAVSRLARRDIAIDCGANVGVFTTMMARTGATVYAFEPNPAAYEALLKNTAHYPNVKAFHAAVTTAPGPVRLYLHKWAGQDPLHWSTGSSLFSAKSNVSKDTYCLIEGIQLAQFIKDLGGPIRILKMDIEGAEVDILNQLLDEGLQNAIEQAFVEVHDKRIRELVAPTQKLRDRLEGLGVTHFRLDWR